MYHSVSNFPAERFVPYDNVPPALFELHMRILSENHFNVITMQELLEIIKSQNDIPPKTIIITFDDGYKNNYLNAFPILEKFGLRATFFLIVGAIGCNQPFEHILWDETSTRYFAKHSHSRLPINWGEVRTLFSYGMEIGSHGLTHRSVGYLGQEMARREIFESKKILEDALAIKLKCFSYPFGSLIYNDYNAHTTDLLKDAGYEGACTSEIGAVVKGDPVYELRRIPVRETDNAPAFKQKIFGAYDWVGFGKRMFQRNIKRVDRVIW